MKIFKGLLPLVVTISVVWGAEEKPKKTLEKLKKTGKRQIGYGLEAIPGAAFQGRIANDGLLAIARPTAHGGIGGYNLVQPIGLITQQDIGFTQGFDGFQGGYAYAPQALVAAPIDVHNAPKTHQLDGGWKGIYHGHGSIRHGHEIAQSLSKSGPYQDGVIELSPVLPIVPHQFDYGKSRNAYSPNALIPMYSGFGTTAKGYLPVQNVKPFNLAQEAFPNGYSFATLHGNQVPQIGPSYHHTAGHVGHDKHGSINHGHQLATEGHQLATQGHHLAKKVHIPSGHSGFIGSHGPKLHDEKAHLYTHQFGKKAAVHQSTSFGPSAPSKQSYHLSAPSKQSYHSSTPSKQSYHPSAPSRQNYHPSAPSGQTYHPSAPSRQSFHQAPSHAPLQHATHDSTSHSTSYSADFNPPQSSYSPDFNPSPGSSENSDFGRTNGHGGHYSGEKKATSFQSFIIHSYKPHPTSHKSKYDSPESDENYSGTNFNSAQALSGETHF